MRPLGTEDAEESRPEDLDFACALIQCAKTGVTPDGKTLFESGEIFRGLVRHAQLAIAAQDRLQVSVFMETCKIMGQTTAMIEAMGRR